MPYGRRIRPRAPRSLGGALTENPRLRSRRIAAQAGPAWAEGVKERLPAAAMVAAPLVAGATLAVRGAATVLGRNRPTNIDGEGNMAAEELSPRSKPRPSR